MSACAVRDIDAVAAQLGRAPRGDVTVVVRCGRGVPQVIRTGSSLPDGSPFPTVFWLTCPALSRAVARLEASGWISKIQARLQADPDLARELAASSRAYAPLGDGTHEPGAPARGIGGAADVCAVKCLHAHYAHYLATGDNPVGRIVADRLSSIDPETEQLCANCDV